MPATVIEKPYSEGARVGTDTDETGASYENVAYAVPATAPRVNGIHISLSPSAGAVVHTADVTDDHEAVAQADIPS